MDFIAADVEEAIEETLQEEYGDYYGGVWGGVWEEWDDNLEHELVVNDEVVKVKVEEISTGTYDDDTYMIFSIKEEDGNVRHFRKFGWTASHDGTYWEGSFDEVGSEQKTITVWRTVR